MKNNIRKRISLKNSAKTILFAAFALTFSTCALATPSAVSTSDTAYETEYSNSENFRLTSEENVFLVGEGTEQNPFVLSNAEQFNAFSKNVSGDNANYAGAYCKLGCNIDFSNTALLPIGTASSPFYGHFDGNGYELKNVSFENVEYVGAIGYMTGGSVKNLSVSLPESDNKIQSSVVHRMGLVVGQVLATKSNVTIEGCVASGDISLDCTQAVSFGGIVGYVNTSIADVFVKNCISSCNTNVYSKDNFVGGLVGYVFVSSSRNVSFEGCVSYASINAESYNVIARAGAFAGYANADESGWAGLASEDSTIYTFKNCISLGNATAKASYKAYYGGFCAYTNDNVTYSSCYVSDSQELSGEAKNVSKNTDVSKVSKSSLCDKDYLSSNLSYDFNKVWYISSKEKSLGLRSVAKAFGGTVMQNKSNVRLDSYSGVRFFSFVDAKKRDYVGEYGYIIALADEVDGRNLTIDYTGKYVKGVAFDTTKDVIFSSDDESVTFTAVLYNIPKSEYSTSLVARSYFKYTDGDKEVVIYSEPYITSVSSCAKALSQDENFDSYYNSLSEEQKSLFDSMLGG